MFFIDFWYLWYHIAIVTGCVTMVTNQIDEEFDAEWCADDKS